MKRAYKSPLSMDLNELIMGSEHTLWLKRNDLVKWYSRGDKVFRTQAHIARTKASQPFYFSRKTWIDSLSALGEVSW